MWFGLARLPAVCEKRKHVMRRITISHMIMTYIYSYFKKVAPVMRDAWSMFHSTRCTNVDSYCEREFQAGIK